MSIFTILHPPFALSWHNIFRATLSRLSFQMKLKNILSSFFIVSWLGFGNEVNMCVNFGRSKVFTTVILPSVVRFLFFHEYFKETKTINGFNYSLTLQI